MKKIIFSICFILCATLAFADGKQDSLLIIKADWSTKTTAEGLTHKQAQIKGLFNSVQSINLIEIPRSAKRKIGVAGNQGMKKTSQQASEKGALAAINGTYYNMKVGNSTCYYKINRELIDNTLDSEFKNRVNGAVRENRGNIEIIEWTKDIEANYKGKRGTVLASGPIMLEDGRISDWSACSKSFIETRHPRSAIYTKKDGTIVFITVDGRSEGNAAGVSIPELAFLIKILGGEEALNLDGGGSTTLWLKGAPDNGVLNYPTDNKIFDHTGERSVSNIFYVK
ncbi:MAG: phosphodiester glycosidase family protein [Alistipes sp.]|nr:phosphodiester glycosidase family protein [Alistipes sp.]